MSKTYCSVNRLYKDEYLAIETDRLRLAPIKAMDSSLVSDYFTINRAFHEKWSQTHGDDYFTSKAQRSYLKADAKSYSQGRLLPFWIFEKSNHNRILGRVSLFNFAFGGMMSCTIGYHLDKEYTSKGYMTEAVNAIVDFAFEELNIHRIEAYVMPDNGASIRLLERCGFQSEGLKHSYMHINGKWEDHLAYYLFNP